MKYFLISKDDLLVIYYNKVNDKIKDSLELFVTSFYYTFKKYIKYCNSPNNKYHLPKLI